MKKLLLTACFLAVASFAYAGPVEDREAMMKSFGRSMGELGPTAKGEKPFDAAAVQTALASAMDEIAGIMQPVAAAMPKP